MTNRLLLQRYVRRSHLAEELAESWREPESTEPASPDFESMIDECLQLRDLTRSAVQALLAELYDEQLVKESFRAEEVVRRELSRGLRIFALVADALAAAGTSPPRAEAQAVFAAAFAELRGYQQQLDDALPAFDPAIGRQARVELERGEGEFAEDVLARLQSQHPASGH
ncbi:MAG: hypothetical protein JNM56_21150 [Planctomycetia bacterium]|nr:hypothetical protein [Planctomycetia bacterium]